MNELVAPEFEGSDLSVLVRCAEAVVLRAPIDEPVRTSFGIMHDRPAVFIKVEDPVGNIGIGEVWCNFPGCGAEHRAALLHTAIFPALAGQEFANPVQCSRMLEKRFQRLAIQSGEFGPIAQCIAGIDIALWDLVARRCKAPLYRLFGGSQPVIRCYASGINPDNASNTVDRCRSEGYNAFKLKIGFGNHMDHGNLDDVMAGLVPGETLLADANQAWSLEEAQKNVALLERYPLGWLEEPMLASAPQAEWQQLADFTSLPIAAGENLACDDEFSRAVTGNWLSVVQPDICKWGGFSGVLPIARQVREAGKRYCPHFLGGGIGLAASAHALAAIGGEGLLEIDSNTNPLRELVFPCKPLVGEIRLAEMPGLGICPSILDELAEYATESRTPVSHGS